jgi:HK97 family phage portal protein
MLPGPPALAVNPRTAVAVADVFACVRALVDTAATLPLVAYRRSGDNRTRYEGPLAELLRRPAPGKPGYALLADVMASLQLYGDAFIGKYRDEDGAISQLGVIEPVRVQVEVRGGLPLYTLTVPTGEQQTVTDRDVLHIRSPLSLDGIRGLSPVAAAREAVESAAALASHASATFKNGARPSGVLKVPPGPEQEEVMENLRAGFEMRHGGPSNSGRVAVLAAEVGFEAISIPPQDLQFIEQRQLATAEIARIFRLPPWIIGAPTGDSLTYSTVEQQGQAFVSYALRPWLVAIEDSINGDPDLCPEGVYVEFLLDALLRADSATRAGVYAQALDPEKGWLTQGEVRRLENLPAVPESEEVANA